MDTVMDLVVVMGGWVTDRMGSKDSDNRMVVVMVGWVTEMVVNSDNRMDNMDSMVSKMGDLEYLGTGHC